MRVVELFGQVAIYFFRLLLYFPGFRNNFHQAVMLRHFSELDFECGWQDQRLPFLMDEFAAFLQGFLERGQLFIMKFLKLAQLNE